MDRSHTMISMKDGALRLALPTAEYTKMVHDVEQEVAFEEAICGQLPFSQRHSRIDTLLEFAVWKHIWNNHPKESSDHAPMLTRSWKHYDQPMESAPAPQRLALTPPRMGEFHYDRRQRALGHQSAVPDLFPSHQPQSQQTHTPFKQHHGLPAANQPSLYSRSSVYPQVPNTPGFNPSSQPRELFPNYSQLPPIGTGRPSPNQDGKQPVPARNLVSIVSRPLETPHTHTNPFVESSKPSDKAPGHQQRRSSATGSNTIEIRSRRRPSTSVRQPPPFPNQTNVRDPIRHGVPVRNETSRKSSVSHRRNSQAEPQERHRKPTDNSSPRGIHKKRRDSLPQRAAANARAAIALYSQSSKESKSEDVSPVSPKTMTRSWAQIAAGKIKTEPLEDTGAVQDIPGKSSADMQDQSSMPSNVQTWAQIAAAQWMGSKAKQELQRNISFGKPSYNFEQGEFDLKDDGVKVKIEEEAPGNLGNGQHDLPTMPKATRLGKKTLTNSYLRGSGMFRRTVHAGL